MKQQKNAVDALILQYRIMQFILLLLVLATAFVYFKQEEATITKIKNETMATIYLIISVALFAFSKIIYVRKSKSINVSSNQTLNNNFIIYKQAKLFQLMLIEGAVILNCIASILTKEGFYIIIAILLSIYFALLAPHKQKIANLLNVSLAQLQEINFN